MIIYFNIQRTEKYSIAMCSDQLWTFRLKVIKRRSVKWKEEYAHNSLRLFRRKRRAQGILENDVNSKLESSANGITNFGLVVSLATIILSVPVILFYRQVQPIGINIWQDQDKLPDGYLSNFATGSLKFPFFSKWPFFVDLEVPFFIWNTKNQCVSRGSFLLRN